jgi:hypothetical protein
MKSNTCNTALCPCYIGIFVRADKGQTSHASNRINPATQGKIRGADHLGKFLHAPRRRAVPQDRNRGDLAQLESGVLVQMCQVF